MIERVVTLDFETYYSTEYSLKLMTVPEYIRDPRFSIIGVAVSVNGGQPEWFSHATPAEYKASLAPYCLDDPNCVVVAHNAMFDGAILEWVLGILPARYFCTMMGSRPFVVPYTGSMSLRAVTAYLKFGAKGDEIYNARGKYRGQFSPTELLRYAAYCCQDVLLAFKLFCYLLPQMPVDEIDLLDLTLKKFTRPQLVLDIPLLESALAEVQEEKARALIKAGLSDAKPLMSNPQFADMLHNLGVDPPLKISPATGIATHAFAQTDLEFMALKGHPNPKVRALVEARLAHKSTIVQTRLEKFLRIAKITPTRELPAALLYYGAHPGRFSGYDGTNLQNLTRGGVLRRVITAPPGHKIVAGDLSQIECRITAALAGQWDLLETFRKYDAMPESDRDPYCEFGDSVYGRTITKGDTTERFVSKMGMLALGFQVGGPKFCQSMLESGVDDMTPEFGQAVVDTYRNRYRHIRKLWGSMTHLISCMAMGSVVRFGPVTTSQFALHLPNGMQITYPELSNRGGSFMYNFGREAKYLYGGKLTENIAQALARIILTTAELRMFRSLKLRAALSVHDELVYVVPDKMVNAVAKALRLCLTAPVPWMKQLPINCEINVGDNYAECK